ncbi:hypothetical protein LEP1GSC047_1432 [Leptospira inadai serovar Lyme str. 10]|uniref:Uncharacterized protein n=1 Tax=Leptospira inadai serovar Lyme str. 10 TaxID=1049790 RepID=V6HAH3_9LEPT|nr:hypothetical protein LEP1GSC047_1432 [Leptospira inadai serovar Lyme str. 10]
MRNSVNSYPYAISEFRAQMILPGFSLWKRFQFRKFLKLLDLASFKTNL